jgi:competence protein ComEC
MKDALKKYLASQKEFFSEYGKVVLVFIFLLISSVSIVTLFTHSVEGKLKVSFLDIGQGDSILIQTPSGKKMIIDGGPSNIVLTRLSDQLSYFDRDIDVMESTHPDSDHVTGLIPVLEKYVVRTILVSHATGTTAVFNDLQKHIDREDGDVHIASVGDVIDFHDGVLVHVLYPAGNYVPKKNDTNDASISVVVTYGDTSFLLTGDLPSIEEQKLIDAGLPKNITAYKAGHHGSKYSSGEQLLSYIRPEYSVISAGKNNTYGHPNSEAMELLKKYSKEIISTIDRGTITFVTDGKKIDIETRK